MTRRADRSPDGDRERLETVAVHPVEPMDLLRIGFVALCGLGSLLEIGRAFGRIDVAAVAGVVVGGYPIAEEAFSALAGRRMTMELSMAIAIVAACAIGEVSTAVVIVLFVLVAEVLEHMTVSRGRRAIAELVNLLPEIATVDRNGALREVRVAELGVGDTVVVKPGARLPVDGFVVSGRSSVDQSSVTGESMPAEKIPGAAVFAGTINQTGALEVRASRIGARRPSARSSNPSNMRNSHAHPYKGSRTNWPRISSILHSDRPG